MTGIGWRLVGWLAGALEPAEREASLGDFEESGTPACRALVELAGLVVRRQAGLWKTWGPWAALVGVVAPMSLLLLQFSLDTGGAINFLSWVFRNEAYIDPALLARTGFSIESLALAVLTYSVAAGLWSWTGGFVMGALARRAIWSNLALFGGIVAALRVAQLEFLPPLAWSVMATVVVALPLLLGAWQGLRLGTLQSRSAIVCAGLVCVATALAIWFARGWGVTQVAKALAYCWPAVYLAVVARRADNRAYTGGSQ